MESEQSTARAESLCRRNVAQCRPVEPVDVQGPCVCVLDEDAVPFVPSAASLIERAQRVSVRGVIQRELEVEVHTSRTEQAFLGSDHRILLRSLTIAAE